MKIALMLLGLFVVGCSAPPPPKPRTFALIFSRTEMRMRPEGSTFGEPAIMTVDNGLDQTSCTLIKQEKEREYEAIKKHAFDFYEKALHDERLQSAPNWNVLGVVSYHCEEQS
jgi:hypothetical protein